jgi:hypothetical protein
VDVVTSQVDLPVACSLSVDQMRARGEEARELLGGALLKRERIPDGVLLRFRGSPELEARVRDFARREKECCPFFEFSFAREDGELELRITAPAEAQALLDALLG